MGEVTNSPESPPDELLKGLLGERATGCWEAELELNGLGKFANVWEPETVSTPGELAGVELDDSLLPKRALYCGGPAGGAATVGGSHETLSRCDTAAYLSEGLELPACVVTWPAFPGCCWDIEWGRECC